MDTISVFPDTNSLYDYPRPGQIRWLEGVFPRAGEVLIVVAPVIIRELNHHKDSGSKPRLAERAANLLQYFDELAERSGADLSVELRPSVRLAFDATDAPVPPPLDVSLNDDRLIANALRFREEHPDAQVLLLTGDVGLKVKSRPFGLSCAGIPGRYRVPAPDDPRERRIRDLERTITALSRARPDLALGARDGARPVLAIPRDLDADGVAAMLADVRERYPCLPGLRLPGARIPADGFSASYGALAAFEALAPRSPGDLFKRTRRVEYNSELDQFYVKYAEYLRDLDTVNLSRRFCPLRLWIENRGGGPATDVDVTLRFPPELIVSETAMPPGFPKEPTPPRPPDPGTEEEDVTLRHLFGLGHPIGALSVIRAMQERPAPNVTGPHVAEGDAATVWFHVGRLKHGARELLPPLFAAPLAEVVGEIEVPYRVNAAECPVDAEGVMTVEVAPERQPDSGG